LVVCSHGSGSGKRYHVVQKPETKCGRAPTAVWTRDNVMSRSDISNFLVHFTSGEPHEAAFARLKQIIRSKSLIGSSRRIKGGFTCVCFSEAPLTSLRSGLVNEFAYSRYSPFGIVVEKQWLFERGGRPVIYQPDDEFDQLPRSHRWRHHRYELRSDRESVDFTWEREWRVQTDELPFDSSSAQIVVPDEGWAERLIAEHDTDQHYLVQHYSVIMDEATAEQYREPFCWRYLTLR
jgi:hypothetical protein